jgi:hypothetical protein
MIERKRIDQRRDEGRRIIVRRGLVRELDETGELDEGAPRFPELEQRPKPWLAESRVPRGPAAVVDEDANAGIGQHRHHRHELVVLDLDSTNGTRFPDEPGKRLEDYVRKMQGD